jgi:hypothetical protein
VKVWHMRKKILFRTHERAFDPGIWDGSCRAHHTLRYFPFVALHTELRGARVSATISSGLLQPRITSASNREFPKEFSGNNNTRRSSRNPEESEPG